MTSTHDDYTNSTSFNGTVPNITLTLLVDAPTKAAADFLSRIALQEWDNDSRKPVLSQSWFLVLLEDFEDPVPFVFRIITHSSHFLHRFNAFNLA